MEFWSDGANPKSEARNPKQTELLKFKNRNPERTLFGIFCFLIT
jgi:hypothetical protein